MTSNQCTLNYYNTTAHPIVTSSTSAVAQDETPSIFSPRDIPELQIEKMWTSADVRTDRADENWLNIILRRAT